MRRGRMEQIEARAKREKKERVCCCSYDGNIPYNAMLYEMCPALWRQAQ